MPPENKFLHLIISFYLRDKGDMNEDYHYESCLVVEPSKPVNPERAMVQFDSVSVIQPS